MNILIRVDSSPTIGMGHVFRCLCLADYLRDLGHRITFATTQSEFGGEEFLVSRKQTVVAFDSNVNDPEEDVQLMFKALAGRIFDWVIVDHYQLGESWEKEVQKMIPQCFAIDDLGRRHDCDVLLDPTIGRTVEHYKSSSIKQAQLLGSQYAFLRTEFLEKRQRAYDRRAKTNTIKKILINYGGGDSGDLPLRTLEVLAKNKHCKSLDITLIANSPQDQKLVKLARSMDSCDILDFCNNISTVFLKNDLAIAAAGTSAYERASLGLPSVMVQLAENQEDNIDNFKKNRLGWVIKDPKAADFSTELSQVIDHVFSNPEEYSEVANGCFEKVSPLGLIKALGEIFGGNLVRLRAAIKSDSQVVYSWQSHPGARKYSRVKTPPSFEEHCDWFDKALSDPGRDLFILQAGSTPVGFLRLDHGARNEVSVMISHAFYGNGLARQGLELMRQKFLDKDLSAYIEDENQASIRVFSSCGYQSLGEGWYRSPKQAESGR